MHVLQAQMYTDATPSLVVPMPHILPIQADLRHQLAIQQRNAALATNIEVYIMYISNIITTCRINE